MHKLAATSATIGLLLAGCGQKTVELPSGPVDRAATCGVIAAASERENAGLKGDLSADAQSRVLHYAMLYAASGKNFDAEKVNIVSQRMRVIADATTKGKWQALKLACAAAFPASRIKAPLLPAKPLDSELECYALADFLRKALGDQGASYAKAVDSYNLLTSKLDVAMTPALRAAGIRNGRPLQERRSEALAAAARLGQPSGVLAACENKYS